MNQLLSLHICSIRNQSEVFVCSTAKWISCKKTDSRSTMDRSTMDRLWIDITRVGRPVLGLGRRVLGLGRRVLGLSRRMNRRVLQVGDKY